MPYIRRIEPIRFAVTTVFFPFPKLRARDNRPIAHAWGPYDTREEANSAKAKILRDHKRASTETGSLTVHVGSINKHDAPGITVWTSTSGFDRSVSRCPAMGDVHWQCDLVKGHADAGHWIRMGSTETHAEAYEPEDRP